MRGAYLTNDTQQVQDDQGHGNEVGRVVLQCLAQLLATGLELGLLPQQVYTIALGNQQ